MGEQPTPAIDALTSAGIAHEVVRREPAHTIEEAAARRGMDVAAVIKTLVVRRSADRYVFVLVPGDRALDWAKLRGHLGERRLSLPDADEALAATGYARGAITPFGATTAWPVIADEHVLDHDTVSMGGGGLGIAVKLAPGPMLAALDADVADVTKPV